MHFITQVVWTTFWQLFPLFERPGRAKEAIQRLHDTQCQLGNMCINISDHSDGKLESIFSSISMQGVGLPDLIHVGLMGWLGRTAVWKTMFWFSYWSQGFYWTYIYEDKKNHNTRLSSLMNGIVLTSTAAYSFHFSTFHNKSLRHTVEHYVTVYNGRT